MSQIEKLIHKAYHSPQNLTFEELCLLFEHFGFIARSSRGSHVVYKRRDPPAATYSIQRGKCGKAKSYQVEWLINWIDEGIGNKYK